MANKNSKLIQIHRSIPFSEVANKEMKAWFDESTRGIGSFYPRGNRKPGSGLDPEEIDVLMPHLISLYPDDRDFKKEVDTYFAEITTRIPSNGLILEIGLKGDNNSPISKDNLPLNIEDYVKYRHAKANPQVAISEADAKGNQLKLYYFVDEKITAKMLEEETKTKDTAMAEYLLVKEDLQKVDRILTNMGEDTRNMEDSAIVIKLREKVEKYPKYFLEVSKNKDLDDEARINKLIQAKILKKVGNHIVISESGVSIGKDMKESVLWWQDQTHSSEVGVLMARYKEFSQKLKSVKED